MLTLNWLPIGIPPLPAARLPTARNRSVFLPQFLRFSVSASLVNQHWFERAGNSYKIALRAHHRLDVLVGFWRFFAKSVAQTRIEPDALHLLAKIRAVESLARGVPGKKPSSAVRARQKRFGTSTPFHMKTQRSHRSRHDPGGSALCGHGSLAMNEQRLPKMRFAPHMVVIASDDRRIQWLNLEESSQYLNDLLGHGRAVSRFTLKSNVDGALAGSLFGHFLFVFASNGLDFA